MMLGALPDFSSSCQMLCSIAHNDCGHSLQVAVDIPLPHAWYYTGGILPKLVPLFYLLAGGHFTRAFWTTLPGGGASGAWRCWALWGDSGPCSSCVSPGTDPVRCTVGSCTKHFVLAWCIFRPRRFWCIWKYLHQSLMVFLTMSVYTVKISKVYSQVLHPIFKVDLATVKLSKIYTVYFIKLIKSCRNFLFYMLSKSQNMII